jgi:hypothetical protein
MAAGFPPEAEPEAGSQMTSGKPLTIYWPGIFLTLKIIGAVQ